LSLKNTGIIIVLFSGFILSDNIFSGNGDIVSKDQFLHQSKILFTLEKNQKIWRKKYFKTGDVLALENENYAIPLIKNNEIYWKTNKKIFGPYPSNLDYILSKNPEYWMLRYCYMEKNETSNEKKPDACYMEIMDNQGHRKWGPYSWLYSSAISDNGNLWAFHFVENSLSFLLTRDQGRKGPFNHIGGIATSREGKKWFAVIDKEKKYYLLSNDGAEYGSFEHHGEGFPQLIIPDTGDEWILDILQLDGQTYYCPEVSGSLVNKCDPAKINDGAREYLRNNHTYMVDIDGREYGPFPYIWNKKKTKNGKWQILAGQGNWIYVYGYNGVFGPFQVSFGHNMEIITFGNLSWAIEVINPNTKKYDLVINGKVYMQNIQGIWHTDNQSLEWLSEEQGIVTYHKLIENK